MSNNSKRRREFEKSLTTFDKSTFQTFNSFEEADEADREYWRNRTPLERMIALEHIRQLAWGYDESTEPRLPRSPELLQLERRPLRLPSP